MCLRPAGSCCGDPAGAIRGGTGAPGQACSKRAPLALQNALNFATLKSLLRLLEQRSLAVTLILAALVALFLGTEVVSGTVMPYTDGNHYVHRAFALDGFLHTGQWARFWNLLTLPRQSIAPPQYPLFFLLPVAWAGVPAYGAIQLLCNFGVLAVASWNLCRVFGRREWAPALFLLCGCENYSFDYPYFFFLDLTFAAFGALSLSFQVGAWRAPSPRASLWAGAGLSMLFWIKPANALIFAATFALAELFLAARSWRLREPFRSTARRLAWMLAGFLPLFLLAVACGALQTIFQLIDHNELGHEWETHLEITGLFRLLYFPLCLAYFYHAVVLLVIAAIVILLGRRAARNEALPGDFPGALLLVVVLSYALWGELFSFWVLVKTMRALVVMLPVLWLALFWLAERARVRGQWLLLGAVAYVLVLADQVETNAFDSKPLSPDKYLLSDAWYAYFPMAWSRYSSGPGVVAHLREVIRAELPQGGRVGVSTERVFLDGRSLSLLLNGRALLDGQPPVYSCVRLFNVDGQYSPNAFLTAKVLILYLAKNAQYSQFTWRENANLLAYIPGHWAPAGDIQQVLSDRGTFLGYLIPLRAPLTQAQLQEGMRQCGAPGPMLDDRLDEYIEGTRYTWPECLDILERWMRKRMG
jgi:hypothetical protein